MAEMELRARAAAVQLLPSPRSTAASASPRELDELKAGRRLPVPSSGEMCQAPDGRPHLPQPRRHNTRGPTTSGLPGEEDEEGDVGEASAEEALLPVPRRGRDCKEPGGESLVVGDEVRRQLWLDGPLVVGNLMQNLIQTISVMFVGHLGELPLAGASMATSFATVTGFSLLTGMANALDTLCGQAFGAGQYHLLGIYKQRAMLLLTVVSIPVSVVWFYAGQIMLLFGQDPDIAMEAGTYARWMIPGLFGYGPAMFHLLVCWLLVHVAGMGSKGAALSTAVSYWVCDVTGRVLEGVELLQADVGRVLHGDLPWGRAAFSGSPCRLLSCSAWNGGRSKSLCFFQGFFQTPSWKHPPYLSHSTRRTVSS